VNVPRLFELYFLPYMMDGDCIDLESFLTCQLFSATTSTTGKIAIGGIITSIARSLGAEPNPKDQDSRCERLDKVTFERMSFCKTEVRCLFWIYHGIGLCLFLMLPKLLF